MTSDEHEESKRKYTTFIVRPYKLTELAIIYHVNVKTLKNWIRRFRVRLGPVVGHYLTIEQVEIFIAKFKLPYYIKTEVLDEPEFERMLNEKMKNVPASDAPEVSQSSKAQDENSEVEKKKKRK